MASIRVSISATTGTYGDKTLASVTLDVPVVGVDDRSLTPSQIDIVEEQLANRIAQVRRELASQIASVRAAAEEGVEG